MTIQEYMYRRFRQAGMTAVGACALLGNIQHESAFIANNVEDGRGYSDEAYTAMVDDGRITKNSFIHDAIGYGYAQWTYYSRKNLMHDYIRGRGKSIGDSDAQIDFLLWEMEHYFQNIWKLLKTSSDLQECTRELLYKWENPAEKENNMRNRYASAQEFYRKFSGLDVDKNSEVSQKMTVEQAIDKVLNLARSEIGYHETGDNWTKYAQDLDRTNWYNGPKNGFAWCDVFVDWLFYKCFGDPLGREMICQPTGSAGAGCLYSAQYYKAAGRWVTTNPQPGDQIFFTYSPGEYSHTGIVESVSNGTVTTIEGNTSDSVARRQYTLGSSTIAGYGRPKWELATGGSVTPTPAPSGGDTPVDYGRILKRGMRGDDVKKLQEDLQKLGFDIGRWGADGDFGNDTYAAVKAFQNEHGLEADGEAGPLTFAALKEALKEQEKPAKPETPADENQNGSTDEETVPYARLKLRELKNGMEGFDVKLAQAALDCFGYSVIVDGIFGKTMETKVLDFQAKKNLNADGVIGLQTWRELLKFE